MLVVSAADFGGFLEPRPDLPASLEGELKGVVSLLAANKWPFRVHATYDESITRFLNGFEEVNRDTPFKGLNWFFDHCETVSDRNLNRIKALGGGIAIQHRMAYQGEYFMDRYGKKAAERTPPVRKMLELGIPVGAGTDATRVASYNPLYVLFRAGFRSIGWLRARPWAASRCIPIRIASVATRRFVFTHRVAVGFQARAARRERLPPASWPILSRSRTIISPCRRNKSRASNRCSRSLAEK